MSEEKGKELGKPFSEQELWNTLNDCVEYKAPGVVGFPIGVLKHCWEFMKPDFHNMIQEFHCYGLYLEWRLNCTHIALIPKKRVYPGLNFLGLLALLATTIILE